MIDLFQDLARRTDWCVLDTETTGLGPEAEIIEITVVSHDGEILLDTLVRPRAPLPVRIIQLTGIIPSMVHHAPEWPEVTAKLKEVIGDCQIIAYNADFDRRMIQQSYRAHSMEPAPDLIDQTRWHCAMQAYMEYTGRSKWVSLDVTAREADLWIPPVPSRHRAWFDAFLTHQLVCKLEDIKTPSVVAVTEGESQERNSQAKAITPGSSIIRHQM